MDNFFATNKSGKSPRAHTYCQLFVDDKVFVYVVPMRREKDFLQAAKNFEKEIGAPDIFVSDAAQDQKSQ